MSSWLWAASSPCSARRIVEKLEWHYTPKHGSWLNVAECELAALSAQCLGRAVPDPRPQRHRGDGKTGRRPRVTTLTVVPKFGDRRPSHGAEPQFHVVGGSPLPGRLGDANGSREAPAFAFSHRQDQRTALFGAGRLAQFSPD